MLSRLSKKVFAALLPMMMCGLSQAASIAPYPTATLTVNGGETSINSAWDNGLITIDFNGFVEIVNYGQFSTPASLASGLAAMFSRDYIAMGLYAKAGANNNQDPTVITFQLASGGTFGPVNIVGSTASFSFTPSGFGSSAATTADVGVATLTLNGAAIASSNYGEGSTGASIAQDLALKARSNLVRVTSEGSNLFLQSLQTGTYNNSYNLSFSTSASFSSPSPSGQLNSSTDLSPVTVYSYAETYYSNGNVMGVADSVMGMWAYGYDSLNRLTSAQSNSAAGGPYAGQYMCWTYDNFGNRLSQSLSLTPCASSPPSIFAATYSTNNQISSMTTPALSVTYDDAGNTTGDGHNSYTYDAEGRVCALNGPQGMIGYQYDGDGNRIGKGTVTNWQSCDITTNGYIPTTDFVLDQGGGQISEVSVTGGTQLWQHTNVTANGMLIATYDTLGLHFYLNDALGSRRVQTDSAGIPEQVCQSLPYGDQLYCTGSMVSPTEHHFTGKERDTESGNDYFIARYYGSSMGRFLSPDDGSDFDPSDPQSWNLYTYVQNNPLRNVDPDGRDCVTQVRTSSTTETATVNTGGCSGVAGNGTSQTYVSGTVTSVQVGADGHSIDIGSNNADGSTTTTNTDSAPTPDNPGIALGYNQAGFKQLNNTGKVVNYFGGIALAGINGLLDAGVLNSTLPETGLLSGVGNPAVKINWMHDLLSPRAGHLPPPGSPDVIQGAVEAALKAGQYSTDGNGVIHGTVQILGKNCGFDGKLVNGVVRISTVYGKF